MIQRLKIVLILAGILFLNGFYAKSQDKKIVDSLKDLLATESLNDSILYLINKGIARHSSDPDEILSTATDALNYCIKIGDQKGIATAKMWIGDAHKLKGNHDQSIEVYLEAADITSTHGYQHILANCYVNIAAIYRAQNDFNKSINFYVKAVNLYRIEKDTIRLGSTLLNSGELFRTSGYLDSAFNNFEEAKVMFASKNYTLGIAYALGNIGLVQNEQQKFAEAEENLVKAINMLEDLGDHYAIAYYRIYLSDAFRHDGKMEEAIASAKNGYDLAMEHGLKEQIRDAGLKLSQLYEELQDYQSAHFYQSQYIVYRDSLNNEETIRRIADLRTEYEVSQKQAEVDILNEETKSQRILLISLILILALVMGLVYVLYKIYRLKLKANKILENTKNEIERQRNQLDILNRNKDRFFSIVSHDLRGPVSSFQNITEILTELVRDKEFDEVENTAVKLEKSSRQLSLLLDNLLSWAQDQQGQFPYHPESLKLAEIFDSTLGVVENMATSKDLELKYNLNYELNLWADRDSTLAIFRNLLGNSIKFTPEGGSITFSSERDGDFALLRVTDTGIGISDEKLSGIFNFEGNRSSWGTRGEKGMGLGLILVHQFVEMNKGKIEINSRIGKGTEIKVWLPLYLEENLNTPVSEFLED